MDGENNQTVIRLDGSHGTGLESLITIITADNVSGSKDTTYQFPYMLVNVSMLQKLVDSNLILGYKIEKIIPKDQKATVLTIGTNGIHGELEE